MKFRRTAYWVCLLLIAVVLLWVFPHRDPQGRVAKADESVSRSPQVPAEVNRFAPPPVDLEGAAPGVLPPVVAAGKREMQAYRLAVRGGTVSLDAVESITGDFHRRRGPQPWMPGMWCIRVLDADMRVLAEETAAAPDEACVVLDPQNLGPDGTPKATQFAGAGEEAMLQVRMPPQAGAKWLKVYRLSGMERADWNTEPMGQLLAAIELP